MEHAAATFVRAQGEALLRAWLHVHDVVIPTDPLTYDDVAERSTRNTLDLALLGDDVVGCSTVRPADDDDPVTVIVRVLPAYRRRGIGTLFLAHALGTARGLGADRVQTIVLGSNVDGLEFALHRGFVETERYTLDGATVPYIHLARGLDPADS